MEISWVGLLILYAIMAVPFIALIISIILVVRDFTTKKLHKSSIVAIAVTIISFVLIRLSAGVI